ncbi:MAG: hypothetical protein ACI4KM_09820 [Oscillospiraceae bacterium]
MTAKSSDNLKLLKNISFAKFGTYYKYKISKQIPAVVLVTIMAFLGFPLYAFSMYMVSVSHAAWQNALASASLPQSIEAQEIIEPLKSAFEMWKSLYSIAPMILILSAIGLFIAVYVVMHSLYRYISGKRFVDMDYSLPVSDDTRFFGDLLAGLTIIVVPVLASIITTIAFNAATDFNCLFALDNYGFREMLAFIPRMAWIELAALIMFYVFSLMIAVCCSRTVEARTVPLTVNFAVPAIIFCITWMCDTSFFGSAFSLSCDTFALLIMTSPFGMILGAFGNYTLSAVTINSAADTGRVIFLTAGEWVGVIVMTVLFAAVGYVLFKLRRSERVGTPYAYKPMRHIVPALVTASVVCILFTIEHSASIYSFGSLLQKLLFSKQNIGWLVAIACITFVLFLVMEIVSGKAFKRFGFTLLRYIATLAGSFVVYLGVILAGNAINENYIPSAADVEKVYVSYSGSMLGLNSEFNAAEDIGNIVEIQRDTLKEHNSDSTNSIHIIYKLKNGKSVNRIYYPSDDMTERITRKLMESGALESQYRLHGTYTYVYDSSSPYPEIEMKSESMLEPDVEFLCVFDGDGKLLGVDPLTLYQAIILDARDTRYDDYFNDTEKRKDVRVIFSYHVNGDSEQEEFEIPGCFKRTNELLAQCGIEFDIDLNEFGAAVLVHNNIQIANDYKYRWIHSDNAAEDYYNNSVVVPLDSALFTELYGYGTTNRGPMKNYGEVDEDWLLFLVYKDKVNCCYPLGKVLEEAGIPDNNNYGRGDYDFAGADTAYGDVNVGYYDYEYNAQLYNNTCVLRIPAQYADRASEIFAGLKN